MNVFKRIIIPKTTETIEYIDRGLEEMDREDFYRLTKVLNKKKRDQARADEAKLKAHLAVNEEVSEEDSEEVNVEVNTEVKEERISNATLCCNIEDKLSEVEKKLSEVEDKLSEVKNLTPKKSDTMSIKNKDVAKLECTSDCIGKVDEVIKSVEKSDTMSIKNKDVAKLECTSDCIGKVNEVIKSMEKSDTMSIKNKDVEKLECASACIAKVEELMKSVEEFKEELELPTVHSVGRICQACNENKFKPDTNKQLCHKKSQNEMAPDKHTQTKSKDAIQRPCIKCTKSTNTVKSNQHLNDSLSPRSDLDLSTLDTDFKEVTKILIIKKKDTIIEKRTILKVRRDLNSDGTESLSCQTISNTTSSGKQLQPTYKGGSPHSGSTNTGKEMDSTPDFCDCVSLSSMILLSTDLDID